MPDSNKMSSGEGDSGEGGFFQVKAGGTTDSATGGYIALTTGYSALTSSGPFAIRTPNAGASGVSGDISLSTGTSRCVTVIDSSIVMNVCNGRSKPLRIDCVMYSSGASGFITLGTGEASGGQGGDIWVRVGTGEADDGGDVIISGTWMCEGNMRAWRATVRE